MKRLTIVLLLIGLSVSSARADRVQIYSVQGFTCDGCEAEVAPLLKKLKGVKKWTFDKKVYEYTLTLADDVPDKAVIDAFDRQGFRAIVGPGQGAGPGAYKPEPYPEGSDVSLVAKDGEAVGELERYRVEGKYTVLDFYADWCGPCRDVDRQLHVVLKDRNDVAVRRFNVVSFESPLAKELGRKLQKLPYVVVFKPDGKRTEIVGENPNKLSAALDATR
jgi:thiol-disulfide isomerase/thioredoxin